MRVIIQRLFKGECFVYVGAKIRGANDSRPPRPPLSTPIPTALQVGGGEGEVSWEDVRRRRHEEEDFPRQAAKVPRYRSKNTVWTVKIFKSSTSLSFVKEVFSVSKFWTTKNLKDSTKPCSSDNEAYEFN